MGNRHENYRIQYPNDNAFILSTICQESHLILLNNLKTRTNYFPSKRTYRKGEDWVSELDVCLVSPGVLDRVNEFSVLQNLELPSDHAPISLSLILPCTDMDILRSRAQYLGDHAVLYSQSSNNQGAIKPLNMNIIDERLFISNLLQLNVPSECEDINIYADNVTATLYQCARDSKRVSNVQVVNDGIGRWERLLKDKDDVRIWKAIDWRGNYCGSNANIRDSSPTDNEFKLYYENNFNPITNLDDISSNVTIPVLDQIIAPYEMSQQVKQMKSDKACGPDGVSPGIFKLLPGPWILMLATLFNRIFLSGIYPQSWSKARMCTIFKKGDRANVNNYRGIHIINSITKIYDMVLCERLKQWFKPFREQAGAQEGRGCIEHIVTLRLLCDIAWRRKMKLYVSFIDFSQAYDRVPRRTLFRVLCRLGCGSMMLCALIAMYRSTESVIGTTLITLAVGVRQGSPTSCLLFIIFVDDLIRIIKESSGPDGFLAWLHVLILMDDTVLLSTTRRGITEKLVLLKTYCNDYGMVINQSKTKFFVISGNEADRESLVVEGLVIEHCDQYVYLGSPFTSDGRVSSAVKAHASAKMPHVLKFVSFINKNNDIPFIVKRRVFEAAIMSTLIYACESWIGADIKPVIKQYNWCLKHLLGVRRTTCNDICYVESGCHSLKDFIINKQHKFFFKIWTERQGYIDDPLMHVINTVIATNTPTSRMVNEYISTDVKDLSEAKQAVIANIEESNSSRRLTYKDINPNFEIPFVYINRHTINENYRLSFTRFRVSGHSLACETGRWNRRGRGRLPEEERLCSCGYAVQTERHVVQHCTLSAHLRQRYRFTSIEELFSDNYSPDLTCKIIHEILSVYRYLSFIACVVLIIVLNAL